MGKENIRSQIIAGSPEFGDGMLYFDDFEGLFQWDKSGTGGDDVVEAATDVCYMGLKSMRIQTRTTGAAENDYTQAQRKIMLSPQGIFLMRCVFMFPDVSDNQDIRFQMSPYTETNNFQAFIYYTPNTPKVEFFNSAGSMEAISSLALAPKDGYWNLMELVLDFKNNKYISFAINNHKHTFDDESMYDNGAAGELRNLVTVRLTADATAPGLCYVDHMLIREVLE